MIIEGEKNFDDDLKGMPIIHYYGKYHNKHNVIVMSLIKNSIVDASKLFNGLSSKTILMIAVQAVGYSTFLLEFSIICKSIFRGFLSDRASGEYSQ